jgi:hypothetical protein
MIDDAFLNDLGLGGLPEEKKHVLVQQMLHTLELRVGTRLSEDMSDEQLDEFERIIGQSEDSSEAATEWLKANNPSYNQVIGEEIEKFKSDLRSDLDQLMQGAAQ